MFAFGSEASLVSERFAKEIDIIAGSMFLWSVSIFKVGWLVLVLDVEALDLEPAFTERGGNETMSEELSVCSFVC